MPIDWFTVGAQMLNFLVLVWLLKRFLYQPVLDAIAAREKKIEAELSNAAQTKAEAHEQQEDFRQKNEDFEEKREEMLHEARESAESERLRLQHEARDAADTARKMRARTLLSDALRLRAEIARHTQDQVFDISRRVLGDLASVSLEQRVCEVFIERLQAIDGAALNTLAAAFTAASDREPALLRSAFELPAAQRAAIEVALKQRFGQAIPLKIETAPDLVGGIELSAQGQKLAWSISDYLGAVSSDLEERLAAAEPA